MLLEHVAHYKNLHFAIDFSNVAGEAPHYHRETEMALVLQGSATYRIHHQEFHLKTGDAIVVDTQDLHCITESSEDVIMLTFYIDMEAFTDSYPNIDFMIFACEEFGQDSSQRHQKMQNKISFLIHHMVQMMFLSQNSETEDSQLAEKLQEILYLMVNHFQGFFIQNREFRSGNDDANPADLDRLYRIIKYMYRNYDRKITLNDVAQNEHLSIYYASHMIKKLSGLSFQNLLNYIRVECAEKLLNEHRYTLTQISELCGFSSLTYFNKCFTTWHGITPSQYKKLPRASARTFHKPFDRGHAFALLTEYLNTELPHKETSENRFSSQHIFLPIQNHYENSVPLQEVCPLHIVANSKQQMYEYRDILARFSADSVSAYDVNTSCDVVNPAQALEYTIGERNLRTRLKGQLPSLLTAEDFPTPFYVIYKALASVKGMICEKQKQYILVKNNSVITLILFNCTESDMFVHLQFNRNVRPEFMIRKTLEFTYDNDMLRKAAETDGMKSCIYDLAAGSTAIVSGRDIQNTGSKLVVKPGDVEIVSFEI